MASRTKRLRLKSALTALILATLSGNVYGGEELTPLPPVTASPLQTDEPVQSGSWFHGEQAPAYGSCGTCACPSVYGGAEYLYLNRAGGPANVPLLVDGGTGDTLLSTNQLDFDHLSGARAWFGMRCGNWGGVEFGYMSFFDAGAGAVRTSADYPGVDLSLPGDLGPGSNVFFGLDLLDVNYTSDLDSYEINFVSCCYRGCDSGCSKSYFDTVEWMAGFRYLSLDENLNLYAERDEVGGIEQGNYEIGATNDLYGAQIGLRTRSNFGRFSIEGLAKAGLFANYAEQRQYVIDYPAFELRPPVGASDTQVAFVGELGLTGIYRFSDHWGLRAGYSLIWLEGLALAPDQLDFSLDPAAGSTINQDGGLLLHGFHVGIEARW